MRLKISQYAKMEGVKYRAIWNRIKKGSGNIMRKAIPNCGIDTANGIEGFVVSPVRITPKGYYPYKQVS